MGKVGVWIKEIREHKFDILVALVFLGVASTLNYYCGAYTTLEAETAYVPDMILDFVPAIDFFIVPFLYVWLYIAVFFILFLYPLFYQPKKIHQVLGLVSLFILVRAIFIVFTHLKTPADAVAADFPWIFHNLHFTNDLFFSGHTGLPFLGFLIFRKTNKPLAYFLLASSIILGVVVLLMHQHYSIDVLSAFFITYGLYRIGNKFFRD